MARKSLSSQVIEEVDRARGLLRPVQDIVDQMTSHMVGAVLESLHRVESMCLAAMQRDVNGIISEPGIGDRFRKPPVDAPAHRKPATTKRPSRARKEA